MARRDYIDEPNIHAAIKAINPDAAVGVRNNDYNKITWYKDTPAISRADIEVKLAELQVIYDAKQYKRDRTLYNGSNVYPSIEDQLDMMWHDKEDDTTTWEDAVQAVKDAHPKP